VKIPQLVSDYALRFNLEPVLVAGVARYLREAGLLSQGGRGVNAPDATPLDAARLLIPFMVGGVAMKAKDAPDVVRDFGNLTHSRTFLLDRETGRDVIQHDQTTPPATLEQAIAKIIEELHGEETRQNWLHVNPHDALYSGVFIKDTLLTAKIVNADWTYSYVHPLWLEWANSGNARPDENGAFSYPDALQVAKRRYGSTILGERHIEFGQLCAISEVLHGNRPIGWDTLPNDRLIGDQL
jgi:hypothetical protein